MLAIERDGKAFQSQQGCTRIKFLQQLATAQARGHHKEVCFEFCHVCRFFGLRVLQYRAL